MKNILDYTEYHLFLSDFYVWRKSLDTRFSYRFICAKIGVKSTGHLALILQGKARISPNLVDKFARLCRLQKRERQYFEYMVLYNQAKSHQDKQYYFGKMTGFAGSAVHQVHAEQYEFYSRWYHSVVWVVLEAISFKDEYAMLGQLLKPSVGAADVQKSVDLLIRLGLVKRDEQGYCRPVCSIVDSGYKAPSVAVNSYIVSMLDMAKEAVDRFEREERTLSWATVSVSEKGYREILEEARQFRRKAMMIAESDHARRVYQINLQMFPVSETLPGKGGRE